MMAGPPGGGRIGAKIADLIGEQMTKARAVTAEGEAAVRHRATKAFMEDGERDLAAVIDQTMGWLRDPETSPPELRALLDDLASPTNQIDFILQIITIASFVLTAMFQIGQPHVQQVLNRAWQINETLPLDPGTAARATAEGWLSQSEAADQASMSGVARERFDVLVSLASQRAPAGEILTALNRQLITETEARTKLERLGFVASDIEMILPLRLAFPTAADLVQMAVREVFTPAVAERFGQYEGLPPQFLELAGKAGLSREFATWYWAAHWDLPSPQQGFEMLHRGVIGEADLTLLLKALDIMPFWRDRLQQISYNPLTRVDVRRAYRLGVLQEADVYKSYLDLGYTPENARILTDFTAKEKLESERELTKVEIVQLFEAGTFTRPQAIPLIVELGYTAEEANLILDLGQHRKERRKLDRSVNLVRSRYISFRIDSTEVTTALDALQVPAEERNDHLRAWDIERELSQPTVPITTLARFLKKGIIDDARFAQEAAKLGYTEEEIVWYMVDVT